MHSLGDQARNLARHHREAGREDTAEVLEKLSDRDANTVETWRRYLRQKATVRLQGHALGVTIKTLRRLSEAMQGQILGGIVEAQEIERQLEYALSLLADRQEATDD